MVWDLVCVKVSELDPGATKSHRPRGCSNKVTGISSRAWLFPAFRAPFSRAQTWQLWGVQGPSVAAVGLDGLSKAHFICQYTWKNGVKMSTETTIDQFIPKTRFRAMVHCKMNTRLLQLHSQTYEQEGTKVKLVELVPRSCN